MKNVLIVEDDMSVGDDLKFFVEDAGNTCTHYDSADQVIDNLNSLGCYDVIVLDIMMMKGDRIPEISLDEETGEELYRRIRSTYPNMKFIILTAKDFSNIKIDFSKENGVQILKKPIVEYIVNDLIDKIGSI